MKNGLLFFVLFLVHQIPLYTMADTECTGVVETLFFSN